MDFNYSKMPVATTSELISWFKAGYFNLKIKKSDALKMRDEVVYSPYVDTYQQYAFCYITQLTKDESNYVSANALLNLLTLDGFAPAYNLIGNSYYYGYGVKQNKEKAFHFYKMAHDKGFATATVNCALYYLDNKDYVNFKKYLEIAITKAYPGAYVIKGDALLKGANGYQENELSAVYLYKLGANLGCEKCQFKLASCYEQGIGYAKDHKLAFEYYFKAACFENAVAAFKVGVYHFEGKYVQKDLYKALYFFELSANLGNDYGMAMAGSCYVSGFGCEMNRNKGLEMLRKSAALGNPLGKELLAKCS